MKNKQDILKLHPMIGRLTPMQWDEIHKAMDAYLNEYKTEQLTLTDVVGRSEQLKALEDLKDFAYDNCQPHNSDRLSEIMERL
jgi:hypothetical protein